MIVRVQLGLHINLWDDVYAGLGLSLLSENMVREGLGIHIHLLDKG